MNTFIVRNEPSTVGYMRYQYGYFLRNENAGVKITFRKNSAFIHIDKYYCVICNDLIYLLQNNRLECNKKSREWLKKYSV